MKVMRSSSDWLAQPSMSFSGTFFAMCLVEIVKADNLSGAARALNSSPAAMSRGLTALESRLGVRLVTRTSRSFELTEEVQLFYERCARIVADIADAEAEASSKGATIE